MYKFNLYIPTDIHFGPGEVRNVGKLMKEQADNVLLLYGSERIFRSGTGDVIVADLEEAGCNVVKCGGVTANADSELIEKAIRLVREQKIDGILAVGGGSVMDSAKAVAVGACAKKNIVDFYRSADAPDFVLPIGVVVTIPATGSEANGISVISEHDTKHKLTRAFRQAIPKFAVLDPELTLTVPAFQTAVGGFDIFAHAFERYFDLTRDSVVLDEMTLGTMKAVVKCLPPLMKDLENLKLREEMMFAATVAHSNMLGPGGDFGCHHVSHILTKCHGLAHGEGLAMIIPAWCRVMNHYDPSRFEIFFKEVFGANSIEEGIVALEAFVREIGLALKIEGEADSALLTEKTVDSGYALGGGFRHLEEPDLLEIFKLLV